MREGPALPVMMTLLALAAGLALLYVGAETLVRGATGLALSLGLTPLVVGLTVVAFGTSSPELTVSLWGALKGSGDIAVGNVVGSNICNIALILGVAALIRPVEVQARLIRLDIPLAAVCSALVLLFLLDRAVGKLEGGVLVLGIFLYVGLCLRLSRIEPSNVRLEFADNLPVGPRRLKAVSLVLIGLVALVLGSVLFVDGAVAVARRLGVSEVVIGLTLVALGTSLPELATSVVAAFRNASDIVVGNIVGSNIFNLTAILGMAALVSPLTSDVSRTDLVIMLLLAVILLPLARTGFRFSRAEGAAMLAAYVGYMIWLAG